MTRIVIDTDDSRSVHGLLLSQSADQWTELESGGRLFFRVPSETRIGVRYVVTTESCTCIDAATGNRCKHQHAVAIYLALRAVTLSTAPSSPHRGTHA